VQRRGIIYNGRAAGAPVRLLSNGR